MIVWEERGEKLRKRLGRGSKKVVRFDAILD